MAYAHARFVIWRTIECQIRTQWTTRLHTILLVDDESELRDVLVTILAEPGHTVLMASDGYEALRILVERRVDLLITDVKMPGISGFELARQAKLMRPDLHILYISGSQPRFVTPKVRPTAAFSTSPFAPAISSSRSAAHWGRHRAGLIQDIPSPPHAPFRVFSKNAIVRSHANVAADLS